MTELDYFVLGAFWRDGPLTPYRVRTLFSVSPTAGWSSSAGSIYPAVRRLEKLGMIEGSEPTGGRSTRVMKVTEAGMRALRRWLSEVPPDLGSPNPDPIRTRAHYISALEPRERAKFLADAISATASALDAAEAKRDLLANDESVDRYYVALGVVFQLRARKQWLASLVDLGP